ncbi:MAG: Gfo/Idh/MocA family oxidoreductase [Acidobacteriia bacterium]|nr:Gfo/Idh/MocA family oxidoreductase [Terriglobia bacterium]
MDPTTRREFLGAGAAAIATGGRVLGANDRINIAFIGNGMQFQSLLGTFKRHKQQQNDVEFAAACDVWEPRLAYAQKQSGAEKTYRDYRDVLQRKDIDGVVLAVPDHWHYPMAREAMLAGKDVYLEKPMTHTLEESRKLEEAVKQTKRVLQVGGTGPATRLYWKINEYIKAGKMGKIVWGLISYNRNTRTGMWDYPIPGVGDDSWPDAKVSAENLDWKMWLGPPAGRHVHHGRFRFPHPGGRGGRRLRAKEPRGAGHLHDHDRVPRGVLRQHDFLHGEYDFGPADGIRELGHAGDPGRAGSGPGDTARRGGGTRAAGVSEGVPRCQRRPERGRHFPGTQPHPGGRLAGLHAQPAGAGVQRHAGVPGDGGDRARRGVLPHGEGGGVSGRQDDGAAAAQGVSAAGDVARTGVARKDPSGGRCVTIFSIRH